MISVRGHDQLASDAELMHHAHNVICALLVALNVGAIGSFYWYDDPWAHPVLGMAEDLEGRNSRHAALVVRSDTTHDELRPLEEHDLYATALIFGIVAREKSKVLTGEYCRGLLLLRMNFYDLNFRREAFLCFYRALEHFVAVRILGVKRLTKELIQLKQGLKKIGAPQDLLDEVREIYSIRSSQVAHAQGPQRDVTLDEVLKTKVFLDFVMHRTFKEQADDALALQRSNGI